MVPKLHAKKLEKANERSLRYLKMDTHTWTDTPTDHRSDYYGPLRVNPGSKIKTLQISAGSLHLFQFWTLGLPEGVLSNHPCGLCVRPCVSSSLNISETIH